MKKWLICFLAVIIVMQAAAVDLGQGFSIGGGVKSGLLIKNSDYAGNLDGLNPPNEYPMTLFFASKDNEAYKGEGWLNFSYAAEDWGLNLSFWSHGDLKSFNDAVHLGDHYLWANMLDNRFRFIGGQGGGAPISTGGWLNADWLGYTGLRLFWVDPSGFSIGVNFPDPDDGAKAEGIKPVTYFSMIMAGAGYRLDNFWVSLIFDNNPIYDDSDNNYDGGLHRPPDAEPIAQSGNIAFGIGAENMFAGKGMAAFDGMVTNLGEDETVSSANGAYTISPIVTTLALKAGYPVTDSLFVELKAKYTTRQGDNADDTASAAWGKFEIEPYTSYRIIDNLTIELAVNYAAYINSFYLAEKAVINARSLQAGWVAPYAWAYDYYSAWQLALRPAVIYTFGGAKMILGYEGGFSRDHVENTIYVDFRWSF
jgi:hypothetical protein